MSVPFRTFFSSAGRLNKKRDLPSPSSWTCWRNCQSETAACLTLDISGSLQSKCSFPLSIPLPSLPWLLSPFCSHSKLLCQLSLFHVPTSLPYTTPCSIAFLFKGVSSGIWVLEVSTQGTDPSDYHGYLIAHLFLMKVDTLVSLSIT